MRYVVQNDVSSMYRSESGWVLSPDDAKWYETENEALKVAQDGSLNFIHKARIVYPGFGIKPVCLVEE